jgi:class 3 adenylate cyclase
VLCRSCRFDNPAGMRFRGQCGAALLASSAAPATPPARTAGTPAWATSVQTYTPRHLAEKILRSRSALEGERRQVTVLFADVAGFTALAEKLDPEEVHRVINGCFEVITAEVHRFEGTINQYTAELAHQLAAALLALGRDGEALGQAEQGLVEARATDSRKYVGWFHVVRGEAALRARPGGHRGRGGGRSPRDRAQMAAAAPQDELRRTLQQWPRVQAVHETLDRLRSSA